MKTVTLLAFILALVLGASASTVNFAGLPAVTTPTLLPNGYGNLDWSNFYYVSPAWSGAGDGFRRGPASLNVAYMGDGACEKEGTSCSASLSASSLGLSPRQGFTAQNAIVAAGNHSETINVSAYNNGQFVGSQQYDLSTSLQQINFPAAWGTITQLVIDTNTGAVVLYALNIQSASGSTNAKADQKASNDVTPPIEIQGPSAVTPVQDPPPHGMLMGDGIVGPPTKGARPNAPKNVARSQKGASDDGLVSPPIEVQGPSAVTPVQDPPPHGTLMGDGIVGPPTKGAGPNAPRTNAE
jgi:hypothetical protein